MKKETYYCDRCGKEIFYPLLKPFALGRKIKLYRHDAHDTDIDLCQECCDDPTEWFMSGKDH